MGNLFSLGERVSLELAAKVSDNVATVKAPRLISSYLAVWDWSMSSLIQETECC